MRRSTLLLIAALAGLAATPYPQERAAASCPGPYLVEVEHLVLTRGTTATVEGRAFTDGCQDSIGCSVGPGCDSCDEPLPDTPQKGVELHLRQGRQTWRLGVTDAGTADDDRLGWTTWTFDVPAGANPGRATLTADGATSARVLIR